MRAARWIGRFGVALALSAAGAVQAASENGWWWNPAQSGRGFSVEVQGDSMFLAGYFYESDGRATWLASAGPMQDATSYQGRLSSYGNGQTLAGDYHAPGAAADAGGVGFHFNDDTHATLTWPGGTIALERFRFSSVANPSLRPQTGWWWNPAESGRGFFFEVQGDQMFSAGYMYDAAGHPVWYASAGPMASAGSYQGRLDQYANGQTLAGPYQAPGSPANAGSISAQFSAADHATITLTDTAGGVAGPAGDAKRGHIFNVERYRYGKSPHIPRSKYWDGKFEYHFDLPNGDGVVDYSMLKVFSNDLVWVDPSTIGEIAALPPKDGSTDYEIYTGDISATFTESVTTSCSACCGTTLVTGTTSRGGLSPSEGRLNLGTDDNYTGGLFFYLPLDLVLAGPCGTTHATRNLSIFVDLSGKMIYLNMSGDRPDVGLVPNAKTYTSWNFNARL